MCVLLLSCRYCLQRRSCSAVLFCFVLFCFVCERKRERLKHGEGRENSPSVYIYQAATVTTTMEYLFSKRFTVLNTQWSSINQAIGAAIGLAAAVVVECFTLEANQQRALPAFGPAGHAFAGDDAGQLQTGRPSPSPSAFALAPGNNSRRPAVERDPGVELTSFPRCFKKCPFIRPRLSG